MLDNLADLLHSPSVLDGALDGVALVFHDAFEVRDPVPQVFLVWRGGEGAAHDHEEHDDEHTDRGQV